MFVTGKVRRSTMQKQQGEALQVVVGGAGGDGEPWHARQDPHDIFSVSSKLAKQLDSWVEPSLAHY